MLPFNLLCLFAFLSLAHNLSALSNLKFITRKFSVLKGCASPHSLKLKALEESNSPVIDETGSNATEKENLVRKYSEEARFYRLEAEKLRLEAEKEKLIMEREKLEKKMVLLSRQDNLIGQLKELFQKDDKIEFENLVISRFRDIDVALFLRLYEKAESSQDKELRNEMILISEKIMEAVEKKDKIAATKITESLKESMNKASISRDDIDLKETEKNIEKVTIEKPKEMVSFEIQNLPLRVPSPLIKFMRGVPLILDEDIEALKKQVFGLDTFYVTSVEKDPLTALFKGNIRGKSSEEAFAKMQEKLQAQPELSKRVRLMLMSDFSATSLDETQVAYGEDESAVVLAISTKLKPNPPNLATYGFSLVTLVLTLGTNVVFALGSFALNPEYLNRMNQGDFSFAQSSTLPIIGGLFGIQLVHELAHWMMSLVKGNKLFGPPFFLPSLQLGMFGAITPFIDFPKNRKEMFDVSIIGPAVGWVVSLATYIAGLYLTNSSSPEMLASFPVVPASFFHESLVSGIATLVAFPTLMIQPAAMLVPIHPLVAVGAAGILINALNMMPVGRLDGGRAATAVFGRKNAALLGLVTLLVQAVSSFFNNYSVQLFWGALIIILQRNQEIPALDEISGVDSTRRAVLYVMLVLTALTLSPFPFL